MTAGVHIEIKHFRRVSNFKFDIVYPVHATCLVNCHILNRLQERGGVRVWSTDPWTVKLPCVGEMAVLETSSSCSSSSACIINLCALIDAELSRSCLVVRGYKVKIMVRGRRPSPLDGGFIKCLQDMRSATIARAEVTMADFRTTPAVCRATYHSVHIYVRLIICQVFLL